MSGKYQNKTPLMRFVHKYTGFIVVGVLVSIAIPVYLYQVDQLEFFERWNCEQLKTYYLLDGGSRFPHVSELTPQQMEKFNHVMDECKIDRNTIGADND